MPTQGGYTMRAQPRRRKDSATKGDEPVFLRKTYDMINTCDPTLACWSENGDTFIIKDTQRFASEIIPTFFKHNKFSSFVRQLNFYGFRKVKSSYSTMDATVNKSNWWEFKHDLFVRNAPNQLSEIKRATHYVAPPEKEVDALRGEVNILQERVSHLDNQVSNLTNLLQGIIIDKEAKQNVEVPLKRKKFENESFEFMNDYDMFVDISGSDYKEDENSLVKHEFNEISEFKASDLPDITSSELDLFRTLSIDSTSTLPGFYDSDHKEMVMESSTIEESENTPKVKAQKLAQVILDLPEELRNKLEEGVQEIIISAKNNPNKDCKVEDCSNASVRTSDICTLLAQVSRSQNHMMPYTGQIESMA